MKHYGSDILEMILEGRRTDSNIAKVCRLRRNEMGQVREYFNLPSRRECLELERLKILEHNKNTKTKRLYMWKEKTNKLVKMWNMGISVLEIGKELEIGVPSIYQKLIRCKHRNSHKVKYRRPGWVRNRVAK